MATQGTEPMPPPSAAEIEAFDSFPWSKHKVFLLGLVETLGGAPALYPNPTHEGSAAFCRTVFFKRQTGRRIDLTQYSLYRDQHPDYPSVDRRLLTALYAAAKDAASLALQTDKTPAVPTSRSIAEAVAAQPLINPFDGTPTPPIRDNVPSWQRRAPTSSLQIDKDAPSTRASATADGEAPYSDKFAKIVEAIQSGKELEGIKQIPDTVLRQPGVVPLGKLTAPRKPWERDDAVHQSSILSFLASTGTDGADTDKSSPYQTVAPLGGVDSEFPPPEPASVETEADAEKEDIETKETDEVEKTLDAQLAS